jgi:site-specific recombinase XerC
MKDLNYQLKKLCQHNRDGSYATQRDRERALSLIADQLVWLGYRGLKATSLKPKHVESLVARWRSEGLSTGALKNRMAVLRWWAARNKADPLRRWINGLPARRHGNVVAVVVANKTARMA